MKKFTLLLTLSLLTILTTAQATFDWQTTELNDGHTLQKMTVNGDIGVIAGYGNSFFKSVDGGASWDTLKLFDPQFNLMDISVKGNVGYIVTAREKAYDAAPDVYASGVILKTTDGGTTWKTIVAPTMGNDDDAPALNPTATLSYGRDFQSVETINDSVAFCGLRWLEYTTTGATKHSGVFKTTNGGENWINVSGDLGGNSISTIAFNGNEGFVGGFKLLYKASANSNTLVDILNKMSIPEDRLSKVFFSDITIIDENELYVTTTLDSIHFSNDGGTTFDKFSGIKGGNDIIKLNDSTFVVGGSKNKSSISTDNGQTWTILPIETSIWEIAGVINDSVNMLAKAAIYKYAVGDLVAGNYNNWVKQDVGDANLQKAFIADDNNVTIVGSDASFFKTSDAGLTWVSTPVPENPALEAMYEEIDFSGLSNVGDEAYVCFNRFKFVDYPTDSDNHDIYWSGGVVYTDNNWETNKFLDIAKVGKADTDDPAKNPNHESCNGVNTSCIEYLGNDVVLLWVGWNDYSTDTKIIHSRVFKTTDAGKNWALITDDFGGNIVQEIESKGDTIYIVGKEILLKSDNAGDTFTNLYPIIDEGEDDAMYFNSIHLGGANEFFLTTYADSILMTTDSGNSFKVIADIKGANDFFKFDKNSWITMGGTGKSKFTNTAGESWDDCHPGSTIFEIGGVYGDKFYALGKGMIFTNLVENFDLTTSIKEIKLDNELSVRYKPTSIELVSSEYEIQRCKVYSITGKLISVAEPNNRTYGLQRSNFQPGIYIIDALIKGKRHTKKIVF